MVIVDQVESWITGQSQFQAISVGVLFFLHNSGESTLSIVIRFYRAIVENKHPPFNSCKVWQRQP